MKKSFIGLSTSFITIALIGCSQGTAPKSVISTNTLQSSSPSSSSSSLPSTTIPFNNATKLPAGWKWLQGQGIQIAVPPHYSGGSPNQLDQVATELPELGLDGTSLASAMGSAATLANLVAIDRHTISKPLVTTMTLAIDSTHPNQKLDQYLSKALQELASQWTIQQSEQMTLKNQKIGFIRATAQKSSTPATLFAYLIPYQGKFCLVLFTVITAVAEQQGKTFQTIVASIQ